MSPRALSGLLLLLVLRSEGADPPPAADADRQQLVDAAQDLVDQACGVLGTASTCALQPVQDRLPPGYPEAFGRSIKRIPAQMAIESAFQLEKARALVTRFGISTRAVDQIADHIDQLVGAMLDELKRPDVVLRAFESYRAHPDGLPPLPGLSDTGTAP